MAHLTRLASFFQPRPQRYGVFEDDEGARIIADADAVEGPRTNAELIDAVDRAGGRLNLLAYKVTLVYPFRGLEGSARFRSFAAIRTEAEAVAFASECGPLIGREKHMVRGREIVGDRVDAWLDHAAYLREAVGIWDVVKAAESDPARIVALQHRLSTLRTRPGEEELVYVRLWDDATPDPPARIRYGLSDVPGETFSWTLESRHCVGRRSDFKKTGDLGSFKVALADVVSFFMAEQTKVEAAVDLEHKEGPVGLYTAPLSLAGGVWLQLAESMAGNIEQRQCKECGKWFGSAPGLSRKSKTYCSDVCRMKAFRTRKRRAVELAAAGRPAEEIAKETGTPLKTVRGWIEKGA